MAIDECENCFREDPILTWKYNMYLCEHCLEKMLRTNIESTEDLVDFFDKNVPKVIGTQYKIEGMTFRDVNFIAIEEGLIQILFKNCSFYNCNFEIQSIVATDFIGCEFENCKFSKLSITYVNFEYCSLINVDFDNVVFQEVDSLSNTFTNVYGMSVLFKNSDKIKPQIKILV